MDVRHWHQAMQHCTHSSRQVTKLWFLSSVSDNLTLSPTHFWVNLHVTYRYKSSNHFLLVTQFMKCMHLLSEMQCKHYEEELKKVFEYLNTYSIDLISYSYASCGWWNKPRSLSRNWGGTTYMQQQMSRGKDRTFHINNTYGLSSKQHWKLTWRHEIRQCFSQISHRWVNFLGTDDSNNALDKTLDCEVVCCIYGNVTYISKSVLPQVCAVTLSWCLQRNTMQSHKLISPF